MMKSLLNTLWVSELVWLNPRIELYRSSSREPLGWHIIQKKNIIMETKKKKGFTLVEIMIVVVIIVLLAAIATPAFQEVRIISQTKAIEKNLSQLASGANKYFQENDVTSVAQTAIVGTDKYVESLPIVAGETYPETITQGTDIQATGAAFGTVSVAF
jgi:type IV pilus assembly protein PilA